MFKKEEYKERKINCPYKYYENKRKRDFLFFINALRRNDILSYNKKM